MGRYRRLMLQAWRRIGLITRRRRREWNDANRDSESNGGLERTICTLIFAIIMTGSQRIKAYTNFPKPVVLVIMEVVRNPLILALREARIVFDPDQALIITMTYLTCAMHFKHLALLFQVGPTKLSNTSHYTLPVVMRTPPRPRVSLRN